MMTVLALAHVSRADGARTGRGSGPCELLCSTRASQCSGRPPVSNMQWHLPLGCVFAKEGLGLVHGRFEGQGCPCGASMRPCTNQQLIVHHPCLHHMSPTPNSSPDRSMPRLAVAGWKLQEGQSSMLNLHTPLRLNLRQWFAIG
jgi:hypothetical protein